MDFSRVIRSTQKEVNRIARSVVTSMASLNSDKNLTRDYHLHFANVKTGAHPGLNKPPKGTFNESSDSLHGKPCCGPTFKWRFFRVLITKSCYFHQAHLPYFFFFFANTREPAQGSSESTSEVPGAALCWGAPAPAERGRQPGSCSRWRKESPGTESAPSSQLLPSPLWVEERIRLWSEERSHLLVGH